MGSETDALLRELRETNARLARLEESNAEREEREAAAARAATRADLRDDLFGNPQSVGDRAARAVGGFFTRTVPDALGAAGNAVAHGAGVAGRVGGRAVDAVLNNWPVRPVRNLIGQGLHTGGDLLHIAGDGFDSEPEQPRRRRAGSTDAAASGNAAGQTARTENPTRAETLAAQTSLVEELGLSLRGANDGKDGKMGGSTRGALTSVLTAAGVLNENDIRNGISDRELVGKFLANKDRILEARAAAGPAAASGAAPTGGVAPTAGESQAPSSSPRPPAPTSPAAGRVTVN